MGDSVLVPHDYEAEAALLASIVLDSGWFERVSKDLDEDTFFDERHQTIWRAMCNLEGKVDQVTLYYELRRLGRDELAPYVSKIIANLPTSEHCRWYRDLILKVAYQRRLLDCAGEIGKLAYEGGGTPQELQAAAEGRLRECILTR